MKIDTKSLLVVNRFESMQGHLTEIERLWTNSTARKTLTNSILYKGLNDNTLVLLYEVTDFSELQKKLESAEYQKFVYEIAPLLASDFHQEIAGLVETVRTRQTLVPTTAFMQLRHIEVPLSGIEPYLDWRKRRIFEFVKRNNKVQSFLAFHSVFSTEPGVLFVTEFAGDPDEYRNSFLTPEYQQIIKEAGHDHIKGGLHTTEYQLGVAPLLQLSNV
jgi:quinol monooxygenase YgiN